MGIKDHNLAWAYRKMHARGVTNATLAAAVDTSQAYVSRVLAGEQRKGRAWSRIKKHLTAEEIELLEKVKYTGKRWSWNNKRATYAK